MRNNVHRKSKRYDDTPALQVVQWALDALPNAALNPLLSTSLDNLAIDLTALYAAFHETPQEEFITYLTERAEQYKLTNVNYAVLAGKPGTEKITFPYPLLVIQGEKENDEY